MLIKDLKIAELGYQIATACDHVPEDTEENAKDLLGNEIDPDDYTLEQVKEALNRFSHWSDSDMISEVMNLIRCM